MEVIDFKRAVYSFIGRNAGVDTTDGDLVANDIDIVLVAMNQARLKAQREYDFLSFEGVYGAQINRYGTSFDAFYTCPEATGASNLVSVKSINGVFDYALDGTSVQLKTPYDFQHAQDMRRTAGVVTSRQFVYVRGRKLFLENVDELTWVAVTGLPFLSELEDSSDEDFFLKYAHDWLLLSTVRQLNMHLKEDQRVQVPQKQLDEAWQSVMRFDLDQSAWTNLD
jgi:hypothetical protein